MKLLKNIASYIEIKCFRKCVVTSVLLLMVMYVCMRQMHRFQGADLSLEKRQASVIVSQSSAECVGSHEDVCLSAPCVHTASRIMKAMDTSVNPCHDFYKYACNGWIHNNEHKINDEQVFYATNLNEIPQKVDLQLERLLDGQLPIDEELLASKAYKDIFSFYQSCKNQEISSYMEALNLLRELKHFQVGSVFDPSKWDLTKAALELLRINGVPLFDIMIDADIKQPNKVSIDITLPRQYGLMPSSSLIGRAKQRTRIGIEFVKRYIKTTLFSDVEEDMLLLDLLTESQSDVTSEPSFNAYAHEGSEKKENTIQRDVDKKSDVTSEPTFLAYAHGGSENKENTIQIDVNKKSNTQNYSPKVTMNYTARNTESYFTGEGISDQKYVTKVSASNIQFHEENARSNHDNIFVPKELQSDTDTASIPTIISQSNATSDIVKTSEFPINTVLPIGSEWSKPDIVTTSIMPDYQGNFSDRNIRNESTIHVISRRNVFKIFRANLDYKRRLEISALILKGEFFNNSHFLWPPQQLHHENEFSYMVEENTTLDHMVAEVEAFITKLDQIRPSANDEILFRLHLRLYNNITLSNLQEQFPMLDWNYFLQELFKKTITDDDIIYIHYPEYLKQLNKLVLDSEPWVVHHSMLALYAHDVLEEIINPESETRDKGFCLTATKTAFGDAMSNLYLNHVGKERIQELRNFTQHLLSNIVAEVKNAVSSSEWLTNKDKTEALSKLQNTIPEVGAHDDYWNITFINELHERVDMSPLGFFGKVISIYKSFRKEYYTYYQQPLPKDMIIWGLIIQPYVVNAFHLQTFNTIVFPEAFFNEPYFTSGAPNYINYGSAGMAMAHELFHGLDYTGTLFNHKGVMNRPFSSSSRAHLEKQVNCFYQLLDHYLTESITIDGTTISMEVDRHSTINEILADVGGLWAAYAAYKRDEAIHGPEPLLPALNLTAHQTFFVAAAQPYCAVIHNLAKIFLMEVDEHLWNDMRINSLFMNSHEFAEVFQCSSKSRMVAAQNCPLF